MSASPQGEGLHPRAICGAKTRSGSQCHQAPVRGRSRCRMHGGTTPTGVASATWKHGGRSQARYRIHGPLGDAYQRHLADPDYMALDQELALVTGQLELCAEELSQLRPLPAQELEENGPCTRCRRSMGEHPVDALDPRLDNPHVRCAEHQPRVVAGFDNETRAARLHEIGTLQTRLAHLIEQRRRLAETEVHRVKVAQDNLSAETAKLLGHAVLVALREESGDLELVGRVQSRTVLILRSLGVKVGE
jgi:hypothetical protein